MSMILRLARSQGLQKGLSLLKPKDVVRSVACRSVTTSPKKDDENKVNVGDAPYLTKKTWVSYGFHDDDKVLDRHGMHVTFFCAISCVLVFGMFIVAYLPDPNLSDWAQREAYLQLRYREEHNLPPINIDVVDPSLFVLPSEEELQANNIEIII